MNEPVIPPISDAPSPEPFFQVWLKAVTKPNEETYSAIANSPDSNPNKAYLWMFIVSLVGSLFTAVLTVVKSMVTAAQYDGGTQAYSSAFGLLCAAPFGAAIGVLFFAIGIALIQWIASLFGGSGSYNKLVYLVSTFGAPIGLVSGILAGLGSIPYIGICFSVLTIGIGLYSTYLQVLSVKVVNNLDWGKAAAAVLIPVFVLIFVCGCLVMVTLMALGPVIGNVFSTVNSSLGGY